jgi:hypothetical protein
MPRRWKGVPIQPSNRRQRLSAAKTDVPFLATVGSIPAIISFVRLVMTGATEDAAAFDYRAIIFEKIPGMMGTAAAQRRIVANRAETGHRAIVIDALQPIVSTRRGAGRR